MTRSKKPGVQIRSPGGRITADQFIAGESPVSETVHPATARVSEAAAPASARTGVPIITQLDVQTSGHPDVQMSASSTSPTSAHEEATPAGSAARRRTTVYLEEDVFKQLKVHCALYDREMSATINEALRSLLDWTG